MATQIRTVEAREKCTPRPSPYWMPLNSGRALGYRKLAARAEGTWLAQFYDSGTRKQIRRSLGAFDNLPAHQRFDAAKQAAEDWFKHLGKGGKVDVITVAAACERYVAAMRAAGREAPAADAQARFRRWVDGQPIGRIKIPKLTKAHVKDWVAMLRAAPVPGGKRSDSTLNRDMTTLRAALNLALADDHASTDAAWREALKPIKNADRRRDHYLDREQRRALIGAAEPDVAVLLKGLALLPLRPGALAGLVVGDLDPRRGVLRIGKDKAGGDRRIKLPPDTLALMVSQAKDKLPAAPLLARADGKPWNKDAWKGPIREAARAAGLPAGVTAYALRHSTITDLVAGGLDLMTVAQISGTSVAMIEKHYSHLGDDSATDALARLAL